MRFFTLLMFLFSTQLFAQQPAYVQFTIDQGLPSNEVYNIRSDKKGLLWFATDFGIASYNGYSFRQYTTSDGLTSNTVFEFLPASGDDVWLRTYNNQICLQHGDKFVPYKNNPAITKLIKHGELIQNFVIDADSNFWFVLNNRKAEIIRVDFKTTKADTIRPRNGNNVIIKSFPDGRLLAAVAFLKAHSDNKVIQHDGITEFNLESVDTTGLNYPRIIRLKSGNLMLSFNKTFCIFDQHTVRRSENIDTQIHSLFQDEQNTCWLSTSNGLSVIENESGPLKIFLPGEMTFSVHQDFEGGYWVTTPAKGVYYFPNITIRTLYSKKGGQVNDFVSVKARQNTLLFVDRKTLYMADIQTALADTSQIARHTSVKAYIQDLGWYGTTPGAAVNFGGENISLPSGKKKNFQFIALAGGGARHVSTLKNGEILIASTKGVTYIDSTGRSTYHSKNENFNQSCTAGIVDSSGRLWVGTTTGLFCRENGIFRFMGDSFPLFRERVTALSLLPDGTLIVSTRSMGLIAFRKNKIQLIGEKNGLSTNLCGKTYVDGDLIWLATNKGLNKIKYQFSGDTLTYQISIMNLQQGLPANRITDICGSGDEIFIATGNGIAWFSKSKYLQRNTPPRIFIESFSSNNKKMPVQNPELRFDDINLSFDFLGLCYRGRGQIQYRYMLKGYDTSWHYTTALTAQYLNLPAGDYTFTVVARNENGTWSKEPASLSFHLPQHYSKTLWFRLLLLFSIVVVISGSFWYYITTQRRKAETETALYLAELKALRAQMKPHFLFNSINAIQHFILNRDEESAHLYLGQFAQLMRRILEQSKKTSITIQDEIETLGLYLELERLRFTKTLNVKIETSSEVARHNIRIPPLLLQPFVENAIWHGLLPSEKNPCLLLSFDIRDDVLVITIEDNGIGRRKAAELRRKAHIPAGMKNVEERIALLNHARSKKIKLEIIDLAENGEASGTKIVINIPLDKSDNTENDY